MDASPTISARSCSWSRFIAEFRPPTRRTGPPSTCCGSKSRNRPTPLRVTRVNRREIAKRRAADETRDPSRRYRRSTQSDAHWRSMKLFECQNCGHPLYFENTRCESCGLRLGYLPAREQISALQPDQERWRALATPNEHYRFCDNAEYEVCNWLVRAGSTERYCAACRHNRMIPDLSLPGNLPHWRL